MPEIALNWLLQRTTVARVIVVARNEEQLRQNLRAVGLESPPANRRGSSIQPANRLRPTRIGIRSSSPIGTLRRFKFQRPKRIPLATASELPHNISRHSIGSVGAVILFPSLGFLFSIFKAKDAR